MAELPERQSLGLRTFIAITILGGWIATIAAFAFFMRVWISDTDLEAKLTALEKADTDEADPDGLPSPTLQILTGPLPDLSVSGSTYVPLYNELYVGGERSLKHLSATLSVRNTSVDQALVVTSIKVFDESGKPVAVPVDVPHLLGPMATAQLYVDQSRVRGRQLTTVVVDWGAETRIAPPLIGAIIIGSYGGKSISFAIPGVTRP